jgi:hypothetical protein
MSVKLGLDCKLYYVVGSGTAQSGVEITNVENLSIGLERDEADVSTRAADGWEVVVGGLRKGTLEFNQVYDTEDAAFVAIQAAFFASDPTDNIIGFFVSDGDGNGLDADFIILGWKVDQPLKEGSKVSITAKPTRTSRVPTWVTAS